VSAVSTHHQNSADDPAADDGLQAIVYQVMEQRGSAHGWNWVFHISDLFR